LNEPLQKSKSAKQFATKGWTFASFATCCLRIPEIWWQSRRWICEDTQLAIAKPRRSLALGLRNRLELGRNPAAAACSGVCVPAELVNSDTLTLATVFHLQFANVQFLASKF
jgi:hypothetical protein